MSLKCDIKIDFSFHSLIPNSEIPESLTKDINEIDDDIYCKQEVVNVAGDTMISAEFAKVIFPSKKYETKTVYESYYWYPSSLLDISNTETWICFAKYNDTVIGFARGLIHHDGSMRIDSVAIYPLFVNKGIGKNMIAFLFNQIRKKWSVAVTIHNIAGDIGEKCYTYGATQNNYKLIT